MPKVSVLIPVYNAAATLQRSVRSILDQTFEDFEIVLVNNGSNDATNEIIEQFTDNRIKSFWLDESDLVAALNFGLNKCTGSYIARMDADDYSYPERLKLQAKYLDDNPDIGLVSGMVKYDGNAVENPGYAAYVQWANSIRTSDDIYLSRFQESALPHPSVMYRKQLTNTFGNYKNNVPEDFELWNRWLASNVKMSKINEVILNWTDSRNRLSRTNLRYNQVAFSAVKSRYFIQWYEKKFKSKNQPDIYIFGYSKTIKTKLKPLTQSGIKIKSFLDVKETSSPQTIFYKQIQNIEKKLILSYVGDRQGKLEIKNYLQSIELTEGKDFLMME